MGRGLSPTLWKELGNLDKDAHSRKSALEALKTYVRELDTELIPLFLDQMSGKNGQGTVTIYEILARVQGPNMVPHIDNIVANIVKTLESSTGSFTLHQACSKVVQAIARHCITLSMSGTKKAEIISLICNPFFDILTGPSENAASGAAFCLKSLVESDAWKFAPDDIVNDICLRAVGALQETLTQTNSHMGLTMTLAKYNSLTLEAFARSLVLSGVQILTTNVSSQKRLSAIQMIHFLMKCVDSRSICSELATIMHAMKKCYKDQKQFVKGAAFEALQTAQRIAEEMGYKFLKDSSSISGSNSSSRVDHERTRKSSFNFGIDQGGNQDRSLRSSSPQSHATDSFSGFDSFAESAISTGRTSSNFDCSRPGNPMQWNENVSVDALWLDDAYSEVNSICNLSKFYFGQDGEYNMEGPSSELFPGSIPTSCSAQRTVQRIQIPQSEFNVDVRSFSSPKEHPSLHQDLECCDLDSFEKQDQTSSEGGAVFMEETDEVDLCENSSHIVKENSGMKGHDAIQIKHASDDDLGPDESILMPSPRIVFANGSFEVSSEIQKDKVAAEGINLKIRKFGKASLSMVSAVAILVPAVVLSTLLLDNGEEGFHLVPT